MDFLTPHEQARAYNREGRQQATHHLACAAVYIKLNPNQYRLLPPRVHFRETHEQGAWRFRECRPPLLVDHTIRMMLLAKAQRSSEAPRAGKQQQQMACVSVFQSEPPGVWQARLVV